MTIVEVTVNEAPDRSPTVPVASAERSAVSRVPVPVLSASAAVVAAVIGSSAGRATP